MRLNFLTPPNAANDLPESLDTEINKLIKFDSKEETLEATYELLTKKYRGYRIRTLTRLFDLFEDDITKLWSKNGFLHCTNMNYLMKIMLLGSGKFSEDDINFKWTTINFYSPHEYLQIRLDNSRWINIDMWGKAYGIKFGDYAHGFHSGSFKAVI